MKLEGGGRAEEGHGWAYVQIGVPWKEQQDKTQTLKYWLDRRDEH